jgi:hypothetical protein
MPRRRGADGGDEDFRVSSRLGEHGPVAVTSVNFKKNAIVKC